jgi:hypothetical protein
MLTVALLSVPQFLSMIYRGRIEGTARETVVLLRAVRLKAITNSCYGVVMIDPAERAIIGFVDRNRNGELDTAATPPDTIVAKIGLASMLDFKDEAGHTGLASLRGLDDNPDVPGPDPVADQRVIYREDGSVLDIGAIRIGDTRGNVLEVNVEPLGSGKIQIRKYQDTGYFARDQVKAWKYK